MSTDNPSLRQSACGCPSWIDGWYDPLIVTYEHEDYTIVGRVLDVSPVTHSVQIDTGQGLRYLGGHGNGDCFISAERFPPKSRIVALTTGSER